jgi:hypothetical protein
MTKKRVTKRARTKKAAPTPAKRSTVAPTPPESRCVTVTLSDSHITRIKSVATQLRARGMKVDSILEKTGQIVGSYSKPASTLKTVDGVLDAEEQPVFRVPPPGSDVR